MPTKQTNKRAKSKAEAKVSTGATTRRSPRASTHSTVANRGSVRRRLGPSRSSSKLRPRKNHFATDVPLDFAAKASIAVGVDGLLLGRRPRLARAPGSWWCKHRDSRGADLENEAMATRQTSKRAKTNAEAKAATGGTNKPKAKSERQPERRNARALSRSAVARTDRAGATVGAAAAPKTSLNGSEMVHDNQARLRSKPVAEPADLTTASASGGEQPPASTKRAQLIAMLERAEGASVAEIGQRLGWLPHTVRAAITGLRNAGREVTRSKDADDRSVYRLAPVKPAGER